MSTSSVKSILISHVENVIHLVQVQAFNTKGENVALASKGATAFQSGNHQGNKEAHRAENAIEDDKKKSNHTEHKKYGGDRGWLRIVLPRAERIEKIVLKNVRDWWEGKPKAERLHGAVMETFAVDGRNIETWRIWKEDHPGLFFDPYTSEFYTTSSGMETIHCEDRLEQTASTATGSGSELHQMLEDINVPVLANDEGDLVTEASFIRAE